MTFKVGDKVRRKEGYRFSGGWNHGDGVFTVDEVDGPCVRLRETRVLWDLDRFELVEPVADKFVPDGLNPGSGRFETVYEPAKPLGTLTAWSDAEIGPFDVQVASKTDLSAVDTLNRLWFNDPVGQKLNQIAIEYKESPDMTDDQLVQKIMDELQAMPGVEKILLSWKTRPNGIAWDRN